MGLDLFCLIMLNGIVFVEGVGFGYVVLYELRVVVINFIVEDVDWENNCLEGVINWLCLFIDDFLVSGEIVVIGEYCEVLEVYWMFVYDCGWI